MKKKEIEILIESLIPKLYSFAYALVPEDLLAEQMIIDSYAVFLVREKNFIKSHDYDSSNKKEKSAIKKYILTHMLFDLYQMGIKRYAQYKYVTRDNYSFYDSFYALNSNYRAILFLKETFKMSVTAIQDILRLEKHQVIEALYNARHEIHNLNNDSNSLQDRRTDV